MAEPRHRPPGDNSFLVSLGQHVAAAAGLVVLMAAAFWGIGALGDDDGELVVADSPPATTAPGDGSPPAGTGTEPAPTATGTEGDAPSSPSPTATSTDDASPDETAGSPDDVAIPPSEISVQVLDAVLIDGNTATQEIADELEADGYDIVVVNRASKVYDVTTVFFTPGFEDSARQIAAAYGFTRVEEKPSNLSSTVRVHLVVGRDRA